MRTLAISKARSSLPAVLDHVASTRETVIVTRHGKALVRWEDPTSLTIEIEVQ